MMFIQILMILIQTKNMKKLIRLLIKTFEPIVTELFVKM